MTDIPRGMASTPLPPALVAIGRERNLAADATLVEVLPQMQAEGRVAVLGMLLDRAHGPSLATVVGRFDQYDGALQQLLVHQAGELSAGVRLAMEGSDLGKRAGAIELIARSMCGSLMYLLGDALRSTCSRTHELAAVALRRMTAEYLEQLREVGKAVDVCASNRLAEGLTEALRKAVALWEIHTRLEALEAALWMSARTECAIRRKLQEPRTRLARAIGDLLTSTSDPRLAGFALRALAIPALCSSAARTIGRAEDRAFIRAILAESWLLGDPRIERGCRSIRSCSWLRERFDEMLKPDDALAARAVQLLAAMGLAPERKAEVFAAMAGEDHGQLRRAVVWHLANDPSDAATDLLTTLVVRYDDGGIRMAVRELRRRQGPSGLRLREQPRGRDTAPSVNRILKQLASESPLDRIRALQVVHKVGLTRQIEERVLELAHDPVGIVRSCAVGMLGELPVPPSRRVLRNAINDPDERVQATAIESLDRLGLKDYILATKPKLKSANSRIRANAIKSLLPREVREAGDVLLDMLGDPLRAHRLSALWVVEKLRLRAMRDRIEVLTRDDPSARVRQRAGQVLDALAGGVARSAELDTRTAPNWVAEQGGGPWR